MPEQDGDSEILGFNSFIYEEVKAKVYYYICSWLQGQFNDQISSDAWLGVLFLYKKT